MTQLQITPEQRYAEDVEFREHCDSLAEYANEQSDDELRKQLVDLRDGLDWLERRRFSQFKAFAVSADSRLFQSSVESDADE